MTSRFRYTFFLLFGAVGDKMILVGASIDTARHTLKFRFQLVLVRANSDTKLGAFVISVCGNAVVIAFKIAVALFGSVR